MIKQSLILKSPRVIWTIIKNTPTLDPLVILLNSKLFYIEKDHKIISFATIKKWKDCTELGTVYTYPEYRGKNLAIKIIKYLVNKYKDIGLICKSDLVNYYKRQGFKISYSSVSTIEKRKNLFNKTLSMLLGYKLKVMKI